MPIRVAQKETVMKYLFVFAMGFLVASSAIAFEGTSKGTDALEAAKAVKHQALIDCKKAAGAEPGLKLTSDQFFSIKSCMERQGYKAHPQQPFSRK